MKKIITLLLILTSLNCYDDNERNYQTWIDGVVPYYYASEFTDGEKYIIELSMGKLEAIANIHFEEKNQYNRNYYIIKKDIKNHSTMGYSQNGDNKLFIYHFYSHVIIHEMMHGLGMSHEHQRADRDLYIKIMWENIEPGYSNNFETIENKLMPHDLFDYDYQSLMHYGKKYFSENNQITIDSYENEIGLMTISKIDQQKLIYLYGANT